MKYILGIVFLLIAATVYFVTRPEPAFEVGKHRTTSETVQPVIADTDQQAVNDDEKEPADTRRAAMEAEFEKLEKARRNLESRLNRLKAIFWGVELPKEQSEAITREMKNGYMLLKNKKLMGAYSDATEISLELSRIEFINNYLEEVERDYRSERLQ